MHSQHNGVFSPLATSLHGMKHGRFFDPILGTDGLRLNYVVKTSEICAALVTKRPLDPL